MTFDPEEFRREFDKACNIAEGVRMPLDVKAVAKRQGGVDILVGHCPNCRTRAALSGEGKHLCRGCRTWLRYRRER